MRKHLSVFMLMARDSVYKILVIMAAMAIGEAAALALLDGFEWAMFFTVIDSGFIYYIYIAAVAMACAVMLTVCGGGGGSRTRYTLGRLSVSERAVMGWHWLCAGLVMLLLWFWQVLLVYVFARWHQAVAAPEWVSSQSLYLSCFRSPVLHSILPLDDVSRFARNLVMALCLGGVCAAGAYKIRRGQKALAPWILLAFFAGTFRAENFEISYDAFVMFACAAVLTVSLVGVFGGDEDIEVEHEEESPEN